VVQTVEQAWKAYGELADRPGADARFAPAAEMPDALRRHLAALMPGAGQFHGQPFNAVLDPRRGPEPLWLIGAIALADGPAGNPATYSTLNQIVRADRLEAPLYQAGPSGGLGHDRRGSFAAQVVATADLDGDGIDELLLRARYYAGGNLKVLKWNGARFVEIRQGGYEGE
jgi:hypothetical protein